LSAYYDRIFDGQLSEEKSSVVDTVIVRALLRIRDEKPFDSEEGFCTWLRTHTFHEKKHELHQRKTRDQQHVELDEADLSTVVEAFEDGARAEAFERCRIAYERAAILVGCITMHFRTNLNKGDYGAGRLLVVAQILARRKLDYEAILAEARDEPPIHPGVTWSGVTAESLRQAWSRGVRRFLDASNPTFGNRSLTSSDVQHAFRICQLWHQFHD
jgi:hypothetical protein